MYGTRGRRLETHTSAYATKTDRNRRRTFGRALGCGRSGCRSGGDGGRSRGRRTGRHRGRQVHGHVIGGRRLGGGRRVPRRHGAVRRSGRPVVLGRLFKGCPNDGRHARVRVPERGAAAQQVEARVLDGRVGRRAARQYGPNAPRRFLAVVRAARDNGHLFDVLVRIRSLQ